MGATRHWEGGEGGVQERSREMGRRWSWGASWRGGEGHKMGGRAGGVRLARQPMEEPLRVGRARNLSVLGLLLSTLLWDCCSPVLQGAAGCWVLPAPMGLTMTKAVAVTHAVPAAS